MSDRAGANTEQAGAGRREERRTAVLRRQQAERLVRAARDSARARRWQPRQPVAYLLGLFLLAGALASVDIVLTLPATVGRNQFAFLLSSGVAVWGLVGLAVMLTRRGAPARQSGLVAYDALRQGLLVAGCLELNLATRMLDLWTPLIGGLIVAVFAVFEIVTLGRRPA